MGRGRGRKLLLGQQVAEHNGALSWKVANRQRLVERNSRSEIAATEETMNIMKALRLMLIAAAVMAGVLAIGAPARAQVAFQFRVNFAPPELPVYEQPIC